MRLQIDQAYSKLRAILSEKGCKMVSELPPNEILVKQGSLWGVSPKTSKKVINVKFEPVDSGTRIVFVSRLSSDWKNLTIIGCVLAAVLVFFCVWLVVDLSAYMVTHVPSFWSWLAEINDNIDYQVGQAFVNLAKSMAIFLSAIIGLEIAVAVYAHSKIDKFVEEVLNLL